MYPPCPTLGKVIAVRNAHWNDLADPDRYYDGYVGRRAVELFRGAGFGELRIEQSGPDLYYAGEGPVDVVSDLHWLDYKGPLHPFCDKLFSLGVLQEETVIAAQAEL